MANNDNTTIYGKYRVEHRGASGQKGYDARGAFKAAPAGGNKMTNLVGYSSVTAGINGFYENRTASANGIQVFDPDIIAMKEPFRMGRFILKIMKYPPFFPEVACEMARWLFEDNVRAVDGVPQNSLSSVSIQIGATGRTLDFPGMYQESGKDLTLTTPEWKGRPLGKFIEWWIGGLSDRATGIGHLWGRDMNYNRANYGMSFLYVILGPTGRAEDIEFACIWHDCWPTAEVSSYLSSNTLGEVGSVGDQSVQFSGIYDVGLHVDALGQIITAQTGLYNETALDAILPSYYYMHEAGDPGYLGMSMQDVKDDAKKEKDSIMKKVSINNIYRLEATDDGTEYNGYQISGAMDAVKAVHKRVYGELDSNDNNPKNQMKVDTQIERAFADVQQRSASTVK